MTRRGWSAGLPQDHGQMNQEFPINSGDYERHLLRESCFTQFLNQYSMSLFAKNGIDAHDLLS